MEPSYVASKLSSHLFCLLKIEKRYFFLTTVLAVALPPQNTCKRTQKKDTNSGYGNVLYLMLYD